VFRYVIPVNSNSYLFWILPFLFFGAAFLYSSVGHGGASAYLAILVLAGFPYSEIAPLVLMFNLIVSSGGFYHFWRGGHFSGKLLFPFVLTSIPAAFWGGSLEVSSQLLSWVLFLTLFLAGLRFLLLRKTIQPVAHLNSTTLYLLGLPMGFVLGGVAGMVGVGGGIFLSPLILFLGWADAKKTAAVSAGFILLNSTSGLVARLLGGIPDFALLIPLGAAVFIGGQIGSNLGATRFPAKMIQQLLGIVLFLASLKVLPDLIQ